MNASQVALQEISLRIKYESLAKLTTELSTAYSYEDVATVLRTNLKYIFDFQAVRLLVFYDSEQIRFDITRHSSSVTQSIGEIYPVERDVISNNQTRVFGAEKLEAHANDIPEAFRFPKAMCLCVYPLRTNAQHHLVLSISNKHSRMPADSDYRFLRFVSEFVMSKVLQLILQDRLEQMVAVRTEQLNDAHKELGMLFYRASHDFTEPLTTLLGLTKLARLQLKNPEELPILLDHTELVIGKAQKMLNKLKLISEAELTVPGMQKVNLYKLVEHVMSQHSVMARRAGIHLSVVITGEAEVSFSFDILETLLNNLVENAIIFHRRVDDAFVRITVHASSENFTLRVEDNGQGIQPDQLKSVFEMYNRMNEGSKGNGLGLYLVKKITEKLGGKVTVKSVWGEGSAFEVRI